jgi:hypothetical protein
MARLITLGFDDPSELLLGNPIAAEVGDRSSVSVRQVYYSGPQLRSLQSFGALVLQGDCQWQYMLGGNYGDLYFSGSFNAADVLYNGWELVKVDTRTDGSFNNTLNVVWNTGGSLSLRRGTTILATSTAGLVTTGVRYNLECYFKPRSSGGEFTVKLDGTQILTYSGNTTDNAATCDGFRLLAGHNSPGSITWWDDVAVNDNSGSVNNSWVGRINLWPLYARGPGDVTQLSRGGLDLGANYAQVRDPDPTGQTFVQGDINNYDLYQVDTLDLPAGATINNIIVQVVGKSTSGSGYIAPMIKAADTESQGTDKLLSNGFLNVRQQAWATNPKTSTAWTESDLSTLQIGVKIRS